MPITAASISTIYGITANYWKIGQLYIDYNTDTGFVNYLGYDSEISAFTGKTPIKNLEIRLSAADITGIYGDAYSSNTLSVTGSSTIKHFDTVISSAEKGTILQAGPYDDYPGS
jgi:hypothetical protein